MSAPTPASKKRTFEKWITRGGFVLDSVAREWSAWSACWDYRDEAARDAMQADSGERFAEVRASDDPASLRALARRLAELRDTPTSTYGHDDIWEAVSAIRRAAIALDRARATAEPVGWIYRGGTADPVRPDDPWTYRHGPDEPYIAWTNHEKRPVFGATVAPSPAPAAWSGLTTEERNTWVGRLVDYGTGFVAPLFAVVEGIEKQLQERNARAASRDSRLDDFANIMAAIDKFGRRPDAMNRIALQTMLCDALRAAPGASPEPTAAKTVLDALERFPQMHLWQLGKELRAALAVGTEIPQKHSEPPNAFACQRRAANPASEYATCKTWCGDHKCCTTSDDSNV